MQENSQQLVVLTFGDDLLTNTVNQEYLSTATIIFRIAISILLGGIIGLERGTSHQVAGFRTYILVSLGSSLIMIINIMLHLEYGAGDIGRMGAQVISGIGFLGAGSIMTTNTNFIRGLTTAAGLWASSAVGLAAGAGYYVPAIFGGLCIYVIIKYFKKIESVFMEKTRVLDVLIAFESDEKFRHFLELGVEKGWRVLEFYEGLEDDFKTENHLNYQITLKLNPLISVKEFLFITRQLEGVLFIEIIE